MSKPVLYIDIDGVLFGHYGIPREFQLRPGVISFLQWAVDHFECRWLTTWQPEEVTSLMLMNYGLRFTKEIKYQAWLNHKTDGIDRTENFYWLDDAPEAADLDDLTAWQATERLIRVVPFGRDELDGIQTILCQLVDTTLARLVVSSL